MALPSAREGGWEFQHLGRSMSWMSKMSRSGWWWALRKISVVRDSLLEISIGSSGLTKTRSQRKCRSAIGHRRFRVLSGERSKEPPKFVSQRIFPRLHLDKRRSFIVAIGYWGAGGSRKRSASA